MYTPVSVYLTVTTVTQSFCLSTCKEYAEGVCASFFHGVGARVHAGAHIFDGCDSYRIRASPLPRESDLRRGRLT
jgi:hypothetical protein